MKLDCKITAVVQHADSLQVTVRSRAANAAEWRDFDHFVVVIPDTGTARKAYFIGRPMTLSVELK